MEFNLPTKLTDFYNKHAQIVNNMGWLFFDKVLRMGVGLLVGVWVARYLGVQDFGALNYAIAITAITGVFATMGIESLVVKKLIENPEQETQILTTAFYIKLLGAAFGVIITILYVLISNEQITLPVILSIGTIFTAMDVVDYYNQSRMQAKKTVIVRGISFLVITIFRVFAILNHLPMTYFALIISFEFLIVFIILYFKIKSNIILFRNFDIPIAKDLFKNGLPLLLTGITIMIYMKIDQVILGKIRTNAEVGIYAAAVKITEIVYVIPSIVCASFYPKILKDKTESDFKYKDSLGKLYFILFWLSIIATIILFLMADKIVALLYGVAYIESKSVLKLYSMSTMFVFMGGATGQYLLAEGLTVIFLYRTILATLINLILNLFLIKNYGVFGAAYSTIITYFFGSFGVFFFKKSSPHAKFVLVSIINFKIIKNVFKGL